MTDEQFLHEFYQRVLFPQFRLPRESVTWGTVEQVGMNETVHYFSIGALAFALIFEDHDGLGRDPEFIKRHLHLKSADFEYVFPGFLSENRPSFSITFPSLSKYIDQVTGTFTIIRI